jgi:hypothetical protein
VTAATAENSLNVISAPEVKQMNESGCATIIHVMVLSGVSLFISCPLLWKNRIPPASKLSDPLQTFILLL